MKRSVLGAVCALVCSVASALTPAQVSQPSTVEIYAAAGEAVGWTLGGVLLLGCQPETVHGYQLAGATNNGWDGQSARERIYAVSCRLRSDASGALTGLAGRDAVFHVSTQEAASGAVIQGLGLAPNRPNLPFLLISPGTCTAAQVPPGTLPAYVCTGTQPRRPMFGVTEISPQSFGFLDIDTSDALNPLQVNPNAVSFDWRPLVQRLIGIAVTPALYRAMQAAQALPQDDQPSSRPSISSALAASYFGGALSDGNAGLGWQHLVGGTAPLAGSQVNICRPAPGSGIFAMTRLKLLSGCAGPAVSPIDASFNDPGQVGLAGIGRDRLVHVVETRGETQMEQCLGQATSVDAYAMGVLSIGRYETDLTPGNWTHRFLRLDGAQPLASAAKLGQYPLTVDLNVVWNIDYVAQLAPSVRILVEGLAAQYGNPDITPIGAPWSSGTLTMPVYGTYAGGSLASQAFTSATQQSDSCTSRVVFAPGPSTLPRTSTAVAGMRAPLPAVTSPVQPPRP